MAPRRVIDISGDGPNNTGRTVTAARDEAVAKGFMLNGLPFMLKRPTGRGDIEDLDLYYRDCVIGGPGSFIVPIRDRSQIADAIRTKIIREIAGLPELHYPAPGSGSGFYELPCRRAEKLPTWGPVSARQPRPNVLFKEEVHSWHTPPTEF